MPVNQFDTPYINNARETYVSQHVQIPYAQMQAAAERKQLEYDLGEQRADQLEETFLKQQALNKDKELRDEIVNGYNARLEQALVQTNGNYAEANAMIKDIGRNVKQDMATGRLGAINTNLQAQQAYTKDILASHAAGDIGADRTRKLLADANQRYEGVQKDVQSTGIYNSYNGQMAVKEQNVDDLVEEASKDYAANMVETKKWIPSGDGYLKMVGDSLEQVTYDEIKNGAMGYLKRHKGFQEDLAQENYLAGRSKEQASVYNADYISGAIDRGARKYSYFKHKQFNDIKGDPVYAAALTRKLKEKDLPFAGHELNIVGQPLNGKNTEEFEESGKTNIEHTAKGWYDAINSSFPGANENRSFPETEQGINDQNQMLMNTYGVDNPEEAQDMFLDDLEGRVEDSKISGMSLEQSKALAKKLRHQDVVNADWQNRNQDAIDFANKNNSGHKDKTLKFRKEMSDIGVPDFVLDMMEKEEADIGNALKAAKQKAYYKYVKPEDRGSAFNIGNIEDIKNSGPEGAEFAEKYLNAIESGDFMKTYNDWNQSNDNWKKFYDSSIDAGGKTVNKMMAVDHFGTFDVPDGRGGFESFDSSKHAEYLSKSMQDGGGDMLVGKDVIIDSGSLGEQSKIKFEDLIEDMRTEGDNAESSAVEIGQVRFLSSPHGGAQYVQFTIKNKEKQKGKSVLMEADQFVSSMGMGANQRKGYQSMVALSNAKNQGTASANIYNQQDMAIGGYDSVEGKAYVWAPKGTTPKQLHDNKDNLMRIGILNKKDSEGLEKVYLTPRQSTQYFSEFF